MSKKILPEIETFFDSRGVNDSLYKEIVRQTLINILPESIFETDEDGFLDWKEQNERFQSIVPYVTSFLPSSDSKNLSFFIVSRYRTNAFRFFFEMIIHWLIPGYHLNASSLFAADFKIPLFGDELYTLCEVIVVLDKPGIIERIQANLSLFQEDVRLGMESSYYAKRILEVRGVSADEKVVLVRERIAQFIRRLPRVFDYDLMTELQYFFVVCTDEFKALRSCDHLARIILTFFLFRKRFKEIVSQVSPNRLVSVKLFRSDLSDARGSKPILSVVVGVSVLREKEVFDKKHLLSAVRSLIPGVSRVEGGTIPSRRAQEPYSLFYVELEKTDGNIFTSEEVCLLRERLPIDLEDQIERPIHTVFMPRNEEEIMRHVLALSAQIKYLRDIPQVVINFDEQSHTHLYFNLIIVHVAKPGLQSTEESLQNKDSNVEYIHERTKTIGYLRNKHTKEALIFRVKLTKDLFLRRDHSIDLYKARQTIVSDLVKKIGDVRDYNGGMMAKQNEVLSSVKDLIGGDLKHVEHILENLFFSISPPVIRALLEPVAIKNLFIIVQEMEEANKKDKAFAFVVRKNRDFVYAVFRNSPESLMEEIRKQQEDLKLHPSELAATSFQAHQSAYAGFIYRCEDEQKQTAFCHMIEKLDIVA